MLNFQLSGPFAVIDCDGVDRRPKLMKARAILAVLAATPGHRHSRSWFLGLLWADRGREQALSSLRSALADIRRHLGPWGSALIANHSEVALDPKMIAIDASPRDCHGQGFLDGFDVANAEGFEDWLRERRMALVEPHEPSNQVPAAIRAHSPGVMPAARIFLTSQADSAATVTGMQSDMLVDCLAKSTEDLGLGETYDGRGRSRTADDFLVAARDAGCSMVLVSEAAESSGGVVARIKVVDTDTSQLVWSQSLIGQKALDLDDPATIGVVAEFIDVMSERLLRTAHYKESDLSSTQLAVRGFNHIFKLGAQNYEAADLLLKRAHELDQRGVHLAWRAYLRTIFLCELEFGSRETVIEEGTALARRAIEKEPHNSMVLALCAHVETMLHRSYRNASNLAERALSLNRCNPLAWATLGVAQAYLGEPDIGFKMSRVGSRLSAGSRYSFQTEAWAMVTGVLAGEFDAAKAHAELCHSKAPTFAPPLRYLSALHCRDGDFERAEQAVERLRAREPDFTLDTLRDDGYPAAGLRKGKVLNALPTREI